MRVPDSTSESKSKKAVSSFWFLVSRKGKTDYSPHCLFTFRLIIFPAPCGPPRRRGRGEESLDNPRSSGAPLKRGRSVRRLAPCEKWPKRHWACTTARSRPRELLA